MGTANGPARNTQEICVSTIFTCLTGNGYALGSCQSPGRGPDSSRAAEQHAGYRDETEYLRVYVGRLRRKIEADPANPKYLLTEPGVGYRFNPQAQSFFRTFHLSFRACLRSTLRSNTGTPPESTKRSRNHGANIYI